MPARVRRVALCALIILASPFSGALAQSPATLGRDTRLDTLIVPGAVHQYAFRLGAGHSIEVTAMQCGVDIVLEVRNARDSVLFTVDSPTGTLARFTSGGSSTDGIWTPDGKRLAFATVQETIDIEWQPADGSGRPEPLVSGPGSQWPWSWTPDGDTLVYEIVLGHPTRIMAAPVRGGTPRVVVESPEYSNRLGRLSHDGRWLAYPSNETGQTEVHVRPFAGSGGKQQISLGGGDQPVWSRDTPELYYRNGTHLIGATFRFGTESASWRGSRSSRTASRPPTPPTTTCCLIAAGSLCSSRWRVRGG